MKARVVYCEKMRQWRRELEDERGWIDYAALVPKPSRVATLARWIIRHGGPNSVHREVPHGAS